MKPLFDALYEYSKTAAAVFHMPGHKLGRAFADSAARRPQAELAAQDVFLNAAAIDATELDETGDLHSPKGPLREAQEMAARAFGAGRTWFLVNGSSCGIFAMIAANCAAGQKILIARDFHYSAFNAMRFARAVPVYMPAKPALDLKSAENALAAHPDAAALYVTRPGYYGNVCDIAEIAKAAHRYGIPVLVDEAHGAHLPFCGKLPVGAMEGGADFCVQSAHKTLPALTQCAYAHMSACACADGAGGAARAGRFSEALLAFQTSSPSFVLTASLDYAREYMEGRGGDELDRVVGQCAAFYDEMARAGYEIPGDIWPQGQNGTSRGSAAKRQGQTQYGSAVKRQAQPRYGRDMTRLVLGVGQLGLSGAEVDKLLWSKYKIKIEMSDPQRIVMIATVADRDEDFAFLKAALAETASANKSRQPPARRPNRAGRTQETEPYREAGRPEPKASEASEASEAPKAFEASKASEAFEAPKASEAPAYKIDVISGNAGSIGADIAGTQPDFITSLHAAVERVPLAGAVGRVSARIVAPYPPGVPLLCPGEAVTAEAVNEITSLAGRGTNFKGVYANC